MVQRLSFSCYGTRIVSFGRDDFVRISDISTGRQVGCMECKSNPHKINDVAFSADTNLILYTNTESAVVKNWKTQTQELVFHSDYPRAYPPGLSRFEAGTAVRDCGPKSPCVWPTWWGRVKEDVFMEMRGVYFETTNDADDGNRCDVKRLAIFDSLFPRFEFCPLQGTLVSNTNYRLKICRLVK